MNSYLQYFGETPVHTCNFLARQFRQPRRQLRRPFHRAPYSHSWRFVVRYGFSLANGTPLSYSTYPITRCESEIARQMSNLQAQSLEMREAPRLAVLSSLADNLALGLLLI
ncbi:MAG: hypothetical protein Q3963_01865 [Coriobacteriaceae bacterium]|nr:hypothetical protein [Coriobacteriaceae bacterium]